MYIYSLAVFIIYGYITNSQSDQLMTRSSFQIPLIATSNQVFKDSHVTQIVTWCQGETIPSYTNTVVFSVFKFAILGKMENFTKLIGLGFFSLIRSSILVTCDNINSNVQIKIPVHFFVQNKHEHGLTYPGNL